MTRRRIEEMTLGFIANSNIYTFGKDKNHEALMIISLKSKIKSQELDEFMTLVEAMFLLFRLKACIPEYHERFSVLIDLHQSTCSLIFVSNFLKRLRKFVLEQCPFTVNNFYFFGVSQDNMIPAQNFQTSVRHMSNSIFFLSDSEGEMSLEELSRVREHFDPDFLEKKYGGGIKNLEEFWPPRCMEDATKTLDENSLQVNHIIPFTYNPAEFRSYSFTTLSSATNSKNAYRMKSKIPPY